MSHSTQSLSTALSLAAQGLGPEHQLFNQLLEKIEKQTSDLHNVKAMCDAHALEREAKLAPLEAQAYQLQEKLVLFLDERIHIPRGLSWRIVAHIREIVGTLLDDLLVAREPSAALQAISEKYYGMDDEGMEDGVDLETSSEMNRAMAQAMGVEVDPNATLSTGEMIEALLRKLQAEDEAAMQAHEARQSKRKKSVKQKKSDQEELDAHSALRNIYRKLVSALHPDRESDPAERDRKTKLMVRVNAANDRKDLRALLHLQLEIAQIDPASVAAMADDKLRSFNRMLKEQLKTLQEEYKFLLDSARNAFGLNYGGINAKVLHTKLRAEAMQSQQLIDQLLHAVKLVQDDTGLKQWVKMQVAAMKSQGYY